LIVLGLIAIAVGDELAIAHPGDDVTLGFTILTFGGPALFLVSQVLFLRLAVGEVPLSRPLGLAALAILAFATAPLTMIAGVAAASAVLVAVAIADTVGGSGPQVGEHRRTRGWPSSARGPRGPAAWRGGSSLARGASRGGA
jgi:Bacterial low temperature requirement A protein (LtrA)